MRSESTKPLKVTIWHSGGTRTAVTGGRPGRPAFNEEGSGVHYGILWYTVPGTGWYQDIGVKGHSNFNKPIQDGGEAKAPLWLNRLSGTD